MSYAWVNDYIGIPYRINGRSMEALDCYGLVKAVYKNRRNIELPDWITTDDRPDTIRRLMESKLGVYASKGMIKETDKPKDLDIAMIFMGNVAHHVGVYINGGILHTNRQVGAAIYEKVSDFYTRRREKAVFYQWQL